MTQHGSILLVQSWSVVKKPDVTDSFFESRKYFLSFTQHRGFAFRTFCVPDASHDQYGAIGIQPCHILWGHIFCWYLPRDRPASYFFEAVKLLSAESYAGKEEHTDHQVFMIVWQRQVEVNAKIESYWATFESKHSAELADFYCILNQKNSIPQTVQQVLSYGLHATKKARLDRQRYKVLRVMWLEVVRSSFVTSRKCHFLLARCPCWTFPS